MYLVQVKQMSGFSIFVAGKAHNYLHPELFYVFETGTSTMYKILTDCSASVRQSMEGLDYYVSEGSQAFADLKEIVEQLDVTLEEKTVIMNNLVKAKHYLKTDYKVFIKQKVY